MVFDVSIDHSKILIVIVLAWFLAFFCGVELKKN